MRKRRRVNLRSSAHSTRPTGLIRPISPIGPRVPRPAVKRRAPKPGERQGAIRLPFAEDLR